MKVHVTGGSGFTGGFVIHELVRRGYEVYALARSAEAARRVASLGAHPVEGDFDLPGTLTDAFATDGVRHLINVASIGFGHAEDIVSAAEQAGIERAVFVSTTAIFTTLPAPSKAVREAAERRIRESQLAWTIVRPTMIYGSPADRNIARLLKVLRKTPVIPVPGGGRRLQQPVHVLDLASALVTGLMRDDAVCESINVPGPKPMTFQHLLRTAGQAIGRQPRLVPIPLRPSIWALSAYERLSDKPRLKAEQLERLAEDKAFDVRPAERLLAYEGRSFAEGVREEARLMGLS